MSPEHIFMSLGISLLLTLVLELIFALIFKIRGKALLVVALVNVLTNPAVVVLYMLLCRHYHFPPIAIVPILEASAVVIEAVIYKTRCDDIKMPFLFSVSANLFSYICGVLAAFILF